MDLKQLHAMGAMVPKTLFKRELEINRPELVPEDQWADPKVAEFTGEWVKDSITVHIRKRNSSDFLQIVQAENADKAHTAVWCSVCTEDGSPVFETIEQVRDLQEWLFAPLLLAVNEVNEVGPKNSQPRTSFGAKSRSPSAEGQSRNGSKPSPKMSGQSGRSTDASAAR